MELCNDSKICGVVSSLLVPNWSLSGLDLNVKYLEELNSLKGFAQLYVNGPQTTVSVRSAPLLSPSVFQYMPKISS